MGKKKSNIKFGPTQPCVNCGYMIPIPMIYCSSKCMKSYERRARFKRVLKIKKCTNCGRPFQKDDGRFPYPKKQVLCKKCLRELLPKSLKRPNKQLTGKGN